MLVYIRESVQKIRPPQLDFHILVVEYPNVTIAKLFSDRIYILPILTCIR